MFDDESQQLRRQKRFLQEVENAIRDANRRILHERIPALDRERFVAFASFVAGLRAEYLHAAMDLVARRGGTGFEALRQHREAYEEAKAAFAALERAIERGYVDIADGT